MLRGSSSFLFGKAAFKKGFFKRKDFWRMAWEQARFISRGEKLNSLDVIKDKALSLVAGHRAVDLTDLTDLVYNDYISPKLWPETVRIAQEHMKAGREVWLVTATPKEIAEVIAHRLGLTGGLGTLVEVGADGVLTGKLVGQTLHGKAKRKAVKALALERNISLKRSYAYSDSVNDLPMLNAVGNPHCVNPDVALRYYAKEASWPILDFKKRELRANKK
ncbi:MAG: HAD-IB family hydrolase [Actinobacteria bacterium]|nr:HAD-IB family hydrolase [Actinomycetota bacterium]